MSGPSQDEVNAASTSSFVTALVLNAAIFGIEIVAFTFLRPYFKTVYEPRTLTPIKKKRVDVLSEGLLSWPIKLFKADYQNIQGVNGMDAYFFVRFLRLIAKIFLPIWFISWAVLMPVTSVNTLVAPHSGLDIFIFGNIESTKTDRYSAHLILAWFFTFWIMWNIKREMAHFITTRQHHLIALEHANSVQAATILVTGIPTKYLNEKALMNMYKHLPGGVKRVWINRDLKDLPDIYARRESALNKLESAENALLKTAAKLRLKKTKAEAKSNPKSTPTDAPPQRDAEGRPLTHESPTTSADPVDTERNLSLAEKLVPAKKRPTHRLPAGFMPFSLPFIGKVVDTIEWCKDEIVTTGELLEKGRREIGREEAVGRGEIPDDGPGGDENDVSSSSSSSSSSSRRSSRSSTSDEDKKKEKKEKNEIKKADKKKEESSTAAGTTYPPLNSAFITFHSQIAAHLAKNALAHHEPYRMTGRYAEVAPEDVIWTNLGMNPYEAKVRKLISWGITAALIIFWAIPVAFVGIVSNVHALCKKVVFLAWICGLPPVVVGIISGILPPVLLAVLMMLLPIFLRMLAKFEGIPKRTGVELSLMTRFFIFQVIHSFLIVTLSSGIIAALPSLLNNPGQIPSLLAQNLPQASTFFLTYILLQGLTGVAGGFLQAVGLIVYYVKLILLGSTPRSIYNIKYGPRTVAWGTLWPGTTLLVVIGLAYSIISPIINGFVCAVFFLFYILYKYLFLWVLEQPMSTDTGGLFFPKAISHVFVGLYIQQICLAALFFLAKTWAEGALMIVLIFIVACFHAMIKNSYGPLLHSLPLSLADRVGNAPPGETGPEETSEEARSEDHQRRLTQTTDIEAQSPISPSSAKGKETVHSPTTESEDEPDMKEPEAIDYGFAHPAASRPQRTVWMAQDKLGLAAEEEAALRERGIRVETRDADMNEKGKVTIEGPPPDEESRN